MTGKTPSGPRGDGAGGTRDERLKAALRANLQRRKAQARARGATAKPRPARDKS